MRIVVSANGENLESPASQVFGRCPTYVFVDTETMAFEALGNPAINAPGGAGIQAAQFIVEHGAQAVLTGNVGPNAFDVLQSANVPVHLAAGGTVREAVEAYKAGQLPATGGANAPEHAGTAGMGMARGMGRGLGRGMGMGRGRGAFVPPTQPPATTTVSRDEEIAALKDAAAGLRKQLAEVVERLDRLAKEE